MKRYFPPATWLFLGIWLVLLIGGRSRFFHDPGTFWHVAVGDRLCEFGFFDKDPYTFTFHDKTWIPHQWLGEGAMYVAYRVGEFDALLLGTATLLAAVYTGLGIRLLRAGLHLSVVAVILALGVAASSGHFHVRPHLATIAGMAIFFVYLVDLENGRIPIARLLWLIPVTWLWSNIHGGVLGGLATFALAVAGWTAARRLRRNSPIQSRRDFLCLFGIWLACATVCFLNPYTWRLPWSWIEIYEMSSLPTIIQEHHPVDLNDWASLSIVGFGIVYIALLLTVPTQRWRMTWLLVIVWFALACMRVRHAPLFAVGALACIADFFPYTRLAARLVRQKSDLYLPPARESEPLLAREEAVPFAVPAAVVLLSLFLQVIGAAVPVLGSGWARLDPDIWPIELKPELREHQFDRGSGTHIFCEYAYGGFIILEAPGYQVFIDDRCELFGDKFLVEFVVKRQMLHDGLFDHPAQPFAEWQATYGAFDLALVETDGPFDAALAQIPAWEQVKRTKTATLWKKKANAAP